LGNAVFIQRKYGDRSIFRFSIVRPNSSDEPNNHYRGISVRTAFAVLSIVLAPAFQSPAFALEPSSAVEASVVLKTETSWDGKPIAYPKGKPEVTGLVIEIAPGGETGWHLHPVPSFAVVLEGELEVRQRNGAVKRLKPGDGLAEVVDTFHNGRNVGSTPVKLVVFYTGAVGLPLTVKQRSESRLVAPPRRALAPGPGR